MDNKQGEKRLGVFTKGLREYTVSCMCGMESSVDEISTDWAKDIFFTNGWRKIEFEWRCPACVDSLREEQEKL